MLTIGGQTAEIQNFQQLSIMEIQRVLKIQPATPGTSASNI